MKKLPPKLTPLIFGFFMSLLMAGLMSFVLTSYYTGFTEGLPERWWHSFRIAWPIALPSIMILSPLVKRIVFGFVGDSDAATDAPQALKMPFGFILFNIVFTVLLVYAIYFASSVKSQQVSIQALSETVATLDKKMDALQASHEESLKAMSQLSSIEAKMDAQKLELDEIKELLKFTNAHFKKIAPKVKS